MNCKNCGCTIEENEKFCSNCGTKIEPEAEPVEATYTEVSENVMPEENPQLADNINPQGNPQPEYYQQQGAAPQGQYAPQTVFVQPVVDMRKSKLTAGLLGIFLGAFGVHNFYLNYTTKAIIQVSVTGACILLSFCTFGISLFGYMGISVWGLIEGIMILAGSINVDGKGMPLKD